MRYWRSCIQFLERSQHQSLIKQSVGLVFDCRLKRNQYQLTEGIANPFIYDFSGYEEHELAFYGILGFQNIGFSSDFSSIDFFSDFRNS